VADIGTSALSGSHRGPFGAHRKSAKPVSQLADWRTAASHDGLLATPRAAIRSLLLFHFLQLPVDALHVIEGLGGGEGGDEQAAAFEPVISTEAVAGSGDQGDALIEDRP
jgi:hypothetical protein